MAVAVKTKVADAKVGERFLVGAKSAKGRAKVTVKALTPERWADLEQLFGERGASAGCWCMWWRLPHKEWLKTKGEKNRRAFRRIVREREPGVLAYVNGQPAAWCAIEPRERYPVLANSRVLKPVDEQAVWSVVCFFVARPYRRMGISAELLRGAVEHARKHGAKIVEGYPVESRDGKMPDAFAWTGLPGAFRNAGFREVARRSKTRPIFRILTGR